ncbi:RlmE family RNA methyltransferase [Limibaculum sp. M0105]|uniref:Ribosomal RNA large subunit methyltransferase E n=1 Tax=Thermohalobaculum xanthum TaxID=2753746 RepID=A0A8J7M5D9_9RHOB|nr:RlmE family RNA methyltransferase [Thermohalobaculum xanthum]MBK0397704.1 RlmE family RNA methyltransferase [Thermohalobaculum xanthum]
MSDDKGNKKGGERTLKTRVKTAKGRRLSSTLWLQRQLNDPYVQRARKEGYRGRAAYKLIEIDDRFQILRPGGRIVDLGCAPGGWCQVAVARVNADGSRAGKPKGFVLGIDLQEVEPIAGAELMQLDFLSDGADDAVRGRLDGPADAVLSDMAAAASGHKRTDHLKIMALAEAAAEFAFEVLAPGGAFVAKVLQGGTENQLLAVLKQRFDKVQHFKPPSSRKDSSEMFVVATGFRPGRGVGDDERSGDNGDGHSPPDGEGWSPV